MLQFPRQLNPSILTVAGLCPKLTLTHPPLLRADEGGGGDASNAVDRGLKLPFPNCSSWMTGFEVLVGGDPEKNGGDEATGKLDLA